MLITMLEGCMLCFKGHVAVLAYKFACANVLETFFLFKHKCTTTQREQGTNQQWLCTAITVLPFTAPQPRFLGPALPDAVAAP